MRKFGALLIGAALTLGATPALARGQSELAEVRRATARFHNVGHAEAAGYGSTLDTLGCFQNPGVGGMGVHYVNGDLLMDGVADATAPEALVYEMRPNGKLKLVGLEYLVPITSENENTAPMLFGRHFHQHNVLPFWIMHAWVWQPNPDGMFTDWNPRVGDCPAGVPIFGG